MKLRQLLIRDAWAGFAAMLVALPSALAYGVAVFSALGPGYVGYGVRAGLIGTVAIGLLAAAVGGAPRVISAPSAPAAAVLGAVVGSMLTARDGIDPYHVTILVAATSLLAGTLQALYGALGGGRLIKFIPYPVVAGYLSAVAVLIFINQVPRFFGLPGEPPHASLTTPSLWQWPAMIVGAVTIGAMALGRRVAKRIPAAILALAAGTAAYLLLALFHSELRRIDGNPLVLGHVAFAAAPPGTSIGALIKAVLSLGSDDVRQILLPALTLSVLLSIDALKTCVIVDALTFARHDSNRTLIGQGVGNAVSAALGGMPGSATIGATMVNVESGAQSRWSGAGAALMALLAAVVLGRWIAWVPLAALAGILLTVAFRMVDWSNLNLLRQRSTVVDFLVIATVVAVAVTVNLMAAAGAGVALAIVLFIRDQIHGSVLRRKTSGRSTSSKQHRLPAEQAVLEQHGDDITVCELQGSLFFGTTDQLYRELEPELKTCRYLILDLRRIQSLDYTATHLFEQFEAALRPRDGWLLFSRVPLRPELRAYLSPSRSSDEPRHARTFATLDDALQWAEDQTLQRFAPAPADRSVALELGDFELTRELNDEASLAALQAIAERRSFVSGQALFRAGDASDELFLVRRGVVRVTLPLNGSGYHTLATFGRGHFFGEMAFLVRGNRSANATATEAVDVFVISRARFDAVSHAQPTVGVRIFARLARALAVRLRRADAELRAFYDA